MARPKKGVTFWDRVFGNAELNENGCLIFKGHKDECGYGRISKGDKLVRVHREVWMLHHPNQEITGVIMHSCDNPSCINIDHLSHGTQADNIADMVSKGRRVTVKGSNQPDAKLTESDIPKIRELLKLGVTTAKISRDFNVSESCIRNINKGRTWTHVK